MCIQRIAIAALIAAAIYGIAVSAGSALYATDVLGTGATHNDCADFRHEIARERGIDEEDVAQREIKERTQACLDEHAMTRSEAFRTEYLLWAIWPAAVCAFVYIFWPTWARALLRQEEVEEERHYTERGMDDVEAQRRLREGRGQT